MSKLVAILVLTSAIGTALASDKADVVMVVHQFADNLNKGDVTTALAACASPASIIDEFPPHQWAGASACADWAHDFATYNTKYGITDATVTLGEPLHVDITGDRAYAVFPATYAYKKNGRNVRESRATMTVAVQKLAEGWRITGWAWAKGVEQVGRRRHPQ